MLVTVEILEKMEEKVKKIYKVRYKKLVGNIEMWVALMV